MRTLPRGNDEEAAKDFEQKYGTQGNAEKLIQEQRARFPRTLMAAQRKRINQEATDALDLEALSKQTGRDVQTAAVKGDTVIYVYLVEGDHRKDTLPYDEVGKSAPKTEAKATSKAAAAKPKRTTRQPRQKTKSAS